MALNFSECKTLRDIAFEFDESVRYFGFLDNKQGMILSELRREKTIQNPENQLVSDLTFFKGAMSSWSMYFGRVRHAVVTHEGYKIILVPLSSGLAIVTTDAHFPLAKADELSAKLRQSLELLTSKV